MLTSVVVNSSSKMLAMLLTLLVSIYVAVKLFYSDKKVQPLSQVSYISTFQPKEAGQSSFLSDTIQGTNMKSALNRLGKRPRNEVILVAEKCPENLDCRECDFKYESEKTHMSVAQEVTQTTSNSKKQSEPEEEALKPSTSGVYKKHLQDNQNNKSGTSFQENKAAEIILRDLRQEPNDQTKWKKNMEMVMKAALRANVLTIFLMISRFPAHLLNIIHINCFHTPEGCEDFLGYTNLLGGLRILVMIIHPVFVLAQIKKIQPSTRD